MRRPVAGTNDGDSFQSWFDSVPIVTKTLTSTTLFGGCILRFGLVTAYHLILNWDLIKNKFHIWRLFTAFIYAGPLGIPFLMHLYFLYQTCSRYEASPYNTGGGGTSADFIWMVLLVMGVLLVLAFLFDMYILSDSLVFAILYVWSRRDADNKVKIFGFTVKVLYLPWLYVALRWLMGGSIVEPLVGIAVGHLYYFLIEVLPVTHGYTLITTPKFCMDIEEYVTGRTPPGAAQPAAYTGIGRTLGGAGAPVGGAGAGAGAAGGAAAGVRRGIATLFGQPAAQPAAAAPATGAGNAPAEPGHAPGLRHRGAGAAAAPSAGSTGGHNWGSGRTLGSN